MQVSLRADQMAVQRQALVGRMQASITVNSITQQQLADRRTQVALEPVAAVTVAEPTEDADDFEDEEGDVMLALSGFQSLGHPKAASGKAKAAGKAKASAGALGGAPAASSSTAIKPTAAAALAGRPAAVAAARPEAEVRSKVTTPTKPGVGRKAKASEWMFDPQAYLDNDGMTDLHEELAALKTSFEKARLPHSLHGV